MTTRSPSAARHATTAGAWFEALDDAAEARGHCDPLGHDHAALFSDDATSVLLVTFENAETRFATGADAVPLAWALSEGTDWSSLCLMSRGPSWFRDPRVIGYFDRLVDDGFFEDFDQVMFYGAGPGGYAAAAYSVVAPQARVFVISPQATLDTDLAGWDHRFRAQRRVDFTTRYGFAPLMTEDAEQVFVLFDPMLREDAMHAALFNAPNVTRLRVAHMGNRIEAALIRLRLLPVLLRALAMGRLTGAGFYRGWRARRRFMPYLRRLLSRLQAEGRNTRIVWLTNGMAHDLVKQRFRRARAAALSVLDKQAGG